jgi:hypothetical protein
MGVINYKHVINHLWKCSDCEFIIDLCTHETQNQIFSTGSVLICAVRNTHCLKRWILLLLFTAI